MGGEVFCGAGEVLGPVGDGGVADQGLGEVGEVILCGAVVGVGDCGEYLLLGVAGGLGVLVHFPGPFYNAKRPAGVASRTRKVTSELCTHRTLCLQIAGCKWWQLTNVA